MKEWFSVLVLWGFFFQVRLTWMDPVQRLSGCWQIDFDIIPSCRKRGSHAAQYVWLYVCHLKIELCRKPCPLWMSKPCWLYSSPSLFSQTLPAPHCWLVGSLPNISDVAPPKLIIGRHINWSYFYTSRTFPIVLNWLSLWLSLWVERFDLFGPNVLLTVPNVYEKWKRNQSEFHVHLHTEIMDMLRELKGC